MTPLPIAMSLDLEAAIKEIRLISRQSKNVTQCYEYGSQGYKDSIRHFLASSSDVAQIAVQPGSAEDLSKIMKILYDRPTVPFAVRGGGHAMIPNASSTTGIQISMSRFTDVNYDPGTTYVEVGAGCLWDQVYSELVPRKRNVIGGASSQGVGVGGWLLGAGYSLKSNKYGLGIDNVVEYEVVVPDGRVLTVNEKNNEKLFQALRGGGNNFGVVTKFKLKTHPQSLTYGGTMMVPGTRVEETKNAIASFIEREKRQEAAIVAAFRHRLENGEQTYNVTIMCVFDAPKPPKSSDAPFREFEKLAQGGPVWTLDPAGWVAGAHFATFEQREEAPQVILRSTSMSLKSLKTTGPTTTEISFPNDAEKSASRSFAATRVAECIESESFGGSNIFREMPYKAADAMLGNSYQYDFGPTNTGNASCSMMDSFSELSIEALDGEVEDDEEDEFEEYAVYSQQALIFEDSEEQASLSKEELVSRPIMVTKKVDNMSELPYRGRFGCLMISKYTKPLLDKMAEEAEKSARYLKKHRGRMIIVDVWPFHEKIFDNSPPGAAWPHEPGKPFGPLLAYFLWEDEKDDEFWLRKLKGTLNRIRVVALDLGLTTSNPAYYNNLSLESMPVREIYRGNLEWLSKVRRDYDPRDVMGRCGGHKIPVAK